MTRRKRISLLVVAATMLLLAAVAAHAQLRGVTLTPETPVVLTGGDFGFRIEGMKGDTPVGVLVVRRNGQWVPAELGGTGVKRLTLR